MTAAGPPSPPHPPPPPPPPSRGFSGFRVSALTGILAALSGAGAVAIGLTVLVESREPWAELEERERAGRAALAAFEEAKEASSEQLSAISDHQRKAARAEISALVLAMSIADPRQGLALPPSLAQTSARTGFIDPARDRVIAFDDPSIARGATLSVALPELHAQLARAGGVARGVVEVFERDRNLWAVGPPLPDGARAIAAIAIAPAAAAPASALERARGALVAIATGPERAERPAETRALLAALSAMVALFAIGAMLWIRRRVGAPIEDAERKIGEYLHGSKDARADTERGGPDARAIARSINALIERAERAKIEADAQRDEEIRHIARSLDALGRGELAASPVPVTGSLAPLAAAIDRARAGLIERLEGVHRLAGEIAAGAADLIQGARKLERGAIEESEALRRVAADAGTAGAAIASSRASLGTSLERLSTFVSAERRAVREVRAEVVTVARRAAELRMAGMQIDTALQNIEAVDEALALLAGFAAREEAAHAGDAAKVVGTRAAMSARRGRAALETLKRDSGSLRDRIEESTRALEIAAAGAPVWPPELDHSVQSSLQEAVMSFVRVSERLIEAVVVLERASKQMRSGAEQVMTGGDRAALAAPKLWMELSQLELGRGFEEDLLAKLSSARSDLEAAASSPEKLTAGGKAMVDEVLQAAEQTRAKLVRLVAATEATLDVLKDVRVVR